MAFVQCSQVRLAYGDRDILDGVSVNISGTTRAALAGANGSGKTTLMRILAGATKPDAGDFAVERGTRVSYLAQGGVEHRGRSLFEEADLAYAPLAALERRAEAIATELAARGEGAPGIEALLAEYHDLAERLEAAMYARRGERIREVLRGLGFEEADLGRFTDEFSGGWQMRIALAKVLLEDPDVLLLDEPTNYLDIEARTWLEEHLLGRRGGYLIVSHDRYFLDTTITEVLEIFGGQLKRYAGDYSAYEKRRAQELEGLLARYEAQQEEIAKAEEFIRRFRYNESKAALVQSRVKQLEKLVPIEIPEGMKRMHFRFPAPPRSGRIAVEGRALSKAYGDNLVIDGLDLLVEAGDKVALAGRNGAGKSTLMRIVAGADRAYRGELRLGAGIQVAYFSQDSADALPPGKSVLETLEESSPFELGGELRNLLGAFLFRGDDVHKSVAVLSGGEKARLALLILLMKPANLLVFDEPTNHLDLTSKDVLLDALKAFPGTAIFVSHDRYFLEALATRVIALERPAPEKPAEARFYPGRFSDYLQRREAEQALAAGATPRIQPGIAAQAGGAGAGPGGTGPAREDQDNRPESLVKREEDKKRKADIKRTEREEEALMAAVEGLEARRAQVEAAMARPENYSDGPKLKALKGELSALGAEKAAKEAAWEAAASHLEGLRAGR